MSQHSSKKPRKTAATNPPRRAYTVGMNRLLARIVAVRAPLVWFLTLTVVFATMYGLIQQQNRLSANDMPTMLATETAHLLEAVLMCRRLFGSPSRY